ncbi:hypothetical protein B0T16DRAFT_164402 [Cercophora newfieldiana]|uniref:Uncharacterized protein n=1 Tax=Cercophora newfieldiana TaxID=92897 RepID=A0AA39Y7P2_9PEZI|nr:hypothetical protein B0T16DRAFT_164402 [Cercophora newfieldiana]
MPGKSGNKEWLQVLVTTHTPRLDVASAEVEPRCQLQGSVECALTVVVCGADPRGQARLIDTHHPSHTCLGHLGQRHRHVAVRRRSLVCQLWGRDAIKPSFPSRFHTPLPAREHAFFHQIPRPRPPPIAEHHWAHLPGACFDPSQSTTTCHLVCKLCFSHRSHLFFSSC